VTLGSPNTNYSYDPWGRRMWEEIPGQTDSHNNQLTNTTCEIYFYGVMGQKLETYSCSYTGGGFVSSLEGINVYFGKKLLQSKGAWVATDKLGTVRANASLGAINYFPYGEERTSTANGVEKFGTYTRDAVGQDYAQQRYYNSNVSAFWSPDPGGIRTANPRNPLSWNRYAYVSGDPANHSDPVGMEQDLCGPDWQTDPSLEGPCCDPGNQLLGAPLDPGCYVGGGGGDGGDDNDEPDPFVCPQQYQNYINAYGADALAAKLPEANALALTSIESNWGNGPFVINGGNDFFNLEAFWKPGTPQPGNKYAYQLGWRRASEIIESGGLKGYYALVATYSSALDSFKSAAAQFSNLTATDPATFAKNAVADGIYAGKSPAFLTREQTFANCLAGQ
jgi:RHS repeat-associated protein